VTLTDRAAATVLDEMPASGDLAAAHWHDRPTLVTGATGLLGCWQVQRLLAAGADVTCLVRTDASYGAWVQEQVLDRVHVVRTDLRDLDGIERVLRDREIDSVFHLAAQTLVTVANDDPLPTFETNIAGTWTLLEACRRRGSMSAIVVASSDKAYGEHSVLPYVEGLGLQPRHPYEVSKACADQIARCYAHTYDLPVAITRCGNFFGGGDFNWSRLIPGTIRSLHQGMRAVIRSDGTSIRDYVYIEDATAAAMMLCERLSSQSGLRGEAFNFSNEVQIDVAEMVRRISKLMGSDLEPEIRCEAHNELSRQYLSAEKARKILSWRPLFSMSEGLERTVAWYTRHFDEQGYKGSRAGTSAPN